MLALQSMGSNHRASAGVSQRGWIRKAGPLLVLLPIGVVLLFLVRSAATPPLESFRFVIFGDRTGEARPGVFEQVWQEAALEDPALVVTAGDTIEGMHEATAQAEWQEMERILEPYRRYPLYLTPGNHDIWSAVSERLFRQHAAHPPHYSFDQGPAHFTILNNSRADELSAAELTFLEKDLKAHAAQPVKFIISHRPSWLISVALHNPDFALHQLARQYGVQYVIAGHVHQMLRFDLEGVTYLSMPSSGGKLRASEKYADGWFFGHALVAVQGTDIDFQIEELKPPYGQGRITKPTDWGVLGLVESRVGSRSRSR
jgi:3',5'-cyclic-AMP phosphodiesterase